MGERRVVREWRSLHQDYLQFAFDSVRACRRAVPSTQVRTPLGRVAINRYALEAVRYSYDALEASVNFVFHATRLGQTHVVFDDTWLKRFLKRKFHNLGMSDKLGLISWAWIGQPFWESEDQFILFADLKKLRDGLTHPRPIGRERRQEILQEEEIDDARLTVSRLLEEKLLGTNLFVNREKTIASFTEDPIRLTIEDAEKAFEITLLHLIRLEEIAWGKPSGWFDLYDDETNLTQTPRDLLRLIPRRFESIWPI